MHVLLMEEVDDVMMSGDEGRERRIMLLLQYMQYMRSELLSQTRQGIKRKWIKKHESMIQA